MAYYYVYSPFSGVLKGQQCYCGKCSNGSNCNSGGYCTTCGSSECKHNTGITNLCCPMDIFGGANTAVKIYVSSNITSIVTRRTGPNDDGDGLCASAPPQGFEWVNEGVKVDLYCHAYIVGTVFFGHIRNRIANGEYTSPNGRTIGYLGNQNCACPNPSMCNNQSCQSGCGCVQGADGNKYCKCKCYDGIHVHMERSSTNGYTYYRNCNTQVYTNTPIYRFTGPDNCPI